MSDYSFIKEVVKKKPRDKKALLIKLAELAAGGAVFGLIAALLFGLTAPGLMERFGKNESSRVSIEERTEDSAEQPSDTSDTTVIEVPATLGLTDYEQFYQEMTEASQSVEKAIVTVSGITDGMDWFRNTYENQNQISGLLIAQTGQTFFVLTEYRAVEKADRIQITFWDHTMADGILLKKDPSTGLCVLSVSTGGIETETKETLEAAVLGSSYGVKQGAPVMAMGNIAGYSHSLTFGVVTSISDRISLWDKTYAVFATDIQGNKESSGVLMNLDGEVIGIILQDYANSSAMVTCIGVSELKGLMEDLSNRQPIPYVGVRGQDVTQEISERTGMPVGVYVEEIQEDSPAMLSGLMSGDIIVQVKGMDVRNMVTYSHVIEESSPAEIIRIKAMRKGAEGYAEITLDVTLGAL